MGVMRLNINSACSVVLTKSGADVLESYYLQFPLVARPDVRLKAGATFKAPLWSLMNIFGPACTPGGAVFDQCVLEITDADRLEVSP